MSLDFNTTLDQAKTVAEPALQQAAAQMKAQFLQSFGELKDASHKNTIDQIFTEAAQVKIKSVMAKTPDEQKTLARAYDLKVMAIETYVLSASIVADAKAASLVKEMLKQVLNTIEIVAMGILKTVVTGLISGAISGLTGGAGGPLAAAAVTAVSTAMQPKPTT